MDSVRTISTRRLGLISNSFFSSCVVSSARGRCCLTRSFGTTSPQYALDDQQVEESTNVDSAQNGQISKRVHILGIGNIGIFVAHALASLPNPPPITLHLRHDTMYRDWIRARHKLTVMKQGLPQTISGFDVSLLMGNNVWGKRSPRVTDQTDTEDPDSSSWEEDTSPIDNLILTVKATQVKKALLSVRDRLSPRSTIVFLQNGMGVQEMVNEHVFPDPATRPSYICGVISHGLYRTKPFEVTHAGVGTTTLGVVHTNLEGSSSTRGPLLEEGQQETELQKEEEDELDKSKLPRNYWTPSTWYLLKLLTKSHRLVSTRVNKSTLLQFQLEKLAVNAVINPLTVLMDCINGDLLYNYYISRIQRLLLVEISTVIRALPELQGLPGIDARFGTERLRNLAVAIEKQTAENTSSMLQDARARKTTELDYINGYIVRRGEELGIKCALNFMVMQMVLAKNWREQKAEQKYVPLDESPPKHLG